MIRTPDWERLGWVQRLRVREVQEAPAWVDESSLPYLPGPGWAPLIDELHEHLVVLDPGYQVLQVKEKFGLLRFYARFTDPAATLRGEQLIGQAAQRSASVCEQCGEPGRLRDRRVWLLTLCDPCDVLEDGRVARRRAELARLRPTGSSGGEAT